MRTLIRVDKRKWDGRLSSSEPARLVSTAPPVLAWFVRAGTLRHRPERGTPATVEHDELWTTASDEWWVLCASAHGETITDMVLHAALPVEPAMRGIQTWIDLDLDFEVHGDRVSLEDEDVFHRHASTMAYPQEVIRGAWAGISRLAPRYTTGDWPFDGWLDDTLARARRESRRVSGRNRDLDRFGRFNPLG